MLANGMAMWKESLGYPVLQEQRAIAVLGERPGSEGPTRNTVPPVLPVIWEARVERNQSGIARQVFYKPSGWYIQT